MFFSSTNLALLPINKDHYMNINRRKLLWLVMYLIICTIHFSQPVFSILCHKNKLLWHAFWYSGLSHSRSSHLLMCPRPISEFLVCVLTAPLVLQLPISVVPGGSRCLSCCHPSERPDSWLWPGPPAVVAGIWEVDWQMEDLALVLSHLVSLTV